jgi:hypothetical protein
VDAVTSETADLGCEFTSAGSPALGGILAKMNANVLEIDPFNLELRGSERAKSTARIFSV